jgi:hypothetical protein
MLRDCKISYFFRQILYYDVQTLVTQMFTQNILRVYVGNSHAHLYHWLLSGALQQRRKARSSCLKLHRIFSSTATTTPSDATQGSRHMQQRKVDFVRTLKVVLFSFNVILVAQVDCTALRTEYLDSLVII